MKLENLNCKIEVSASVNPSEDPEKVKKAISNILSINNIQTGDFYIMAETNDFQLMEKIYESVHSSRSQKVLQKQLEKHMNNNSTWFFLNKQAAFVGKVVLCENEDESPLGPVKVVLSSSNINKIIDSLIL